MTQPVVISVLETDIAELRSMIGETALTDAQLAEIIVLDMGPDHLANLDKSASRVWRRKAAETADLTDTSESGSTRALSKLHKNALDMAAIYDARAAGAEAAVDAVTTRRAQTRPIRRA